MDVRVGPLRRLSAEELMVLNCGVGEDSWESFGLQGDQTSILKEINPEYSLEELMLKLQYFGHLMRRADSLKIPDAGKDWRQEDKGTIEDEMVGWHHRLNGRGFEQTPGDGEGQGSLACFSPWGLKELDMTEGLNKQHEGGVWENLGNNVIALYLKWSYDIQPYSFVKILATVSQRVILLYITCFKWRWNEDFFIRQVKWSVMLVAQSCPTLCNPLDCNMPGFPVLHHLPEVA